MRIAHISDLHIVTPDNAMAKVMRTESFLRAAVKRLVERDPDIVVITGDLVDSGKAEEYELLAELLSPLTMPVYLVPGNHDEREAMRTVMRKHGHNYLPRSGFLNYSVDLGDLRLVAVDTLVPKAPGGLVCDEKLSWLSRELASSDKPTLVLQHHPPFATGITQMDAMGLSGSAKEAEVIGKFAHVERVLCGHLHRYITQRFAGTIAITAPSTAHAIDLDLRSGGHLAVIHEPPAALVHFWNSRQLVTHLDHLGDFGEPHVLNLDPH